MLVLALLVPIDLKELNSFYERLLRDFFQRLLHFMMINHLFQKVLLCFFGLFFDFLEFIVRTETLSQLISELSVVAMRANIDNFGRETKTL